AGVDEQADAVRGLESEGDVHAAERAALASFGRHERDSDADVLNDDGDRPELAFDARAESDVEPASAPESRLDVDRLHGDRPEREMDGLLEFERSAAVERHAVLRRPVEVGAELELEPFADQLLDEAVALAGFDDEANLVRLLSGADGEEDLRISDLPLSS